MGPDDGRRQSIRLKPILLVLRQCARLTVWLRVAFDEGSENKSRVRTDLPSNDSQGRCQVGGPQHNRPPRQHILSVKCRIHKLVLDALGVQSIALVVGGSLGGFAALEWPLSTPPGYVQNVVPIATSTEHGAWGISWGEAQRQCIYADARFNNGYYLPTPQGQPRKGLAAARIVGMLTYRSSVSFEARFGRKPGKRSRSPNFTAKSNGKCLQSVTTCAINGEKEPHNRNDEDITSPIPDKFTAQDYLDYQGEKFVGRFDANCYISLTQKMDTHDIFRGRKCETMARNRVLTDSHGAPSATVGMETVKSLVVGVDSDMLFTHEQQLRVADAFPDARCVMLRSPDGHDGFLLEFEALNSLILDHLKKECSWIYANPPTSTAENEVQPPVARDSVFGEMETDWK